LLFLDICFKSIDIIVIEQVVDIDILADIDGAAIIHVDKALVGFDETANTSPKSMEAAFQALDQNSFHKAADVALLLPLKFGKLFATRVIEQWDIASITEILKQADSVIEGYFQLP